MLEQDQEKLLEEAVAVVKEQSRYMKRAIDNENLREALKYGSNIVSELRTSLLSPKNYYELYMLVFHELQHLAAFFADKSRHGRKMSELYESVQHAGNILPRLYLLVTVAAGYIKSREAPAKDILRDVTELCKGVQHPMRGLFLRYYLTQMCKDKLPDAGTEYESEGGGTLQDAFDFLLTNFTEATRLWVRLQHQGNLRDRQRREKERHDLRVLVGANLVRMAQLEGMTQEFYSESALPKLLEQIVGCKDAMAQQYLLDCVIQVFSDECHLHTLDQLLNACMNVQPAVDLKPVLVNLMNRLASFVQGQPEAIPDDVNIFLLFRRHLSDLLSRPVAGEAVVTNGRGNTDAQASGFMQLGSLLELEVAFLGFTLTLHPDRVDYVDLILGDTACLLGRLLSRPGEKLEGAGVDSVVELLSSPLRSLALSTLELENFASLMRFLNFYTRKQVAVSMVDALMEANVPLNDPEGVERFLQFVSPLVVDEEDAPNSASTNTSQSQDDEEDFTLEQQRVAKLVHAFQHSDTDVMFRMYMAAYSCFAQGGHRRMQHSLPPLVIGALKLVPLIVHREQQVLACVEDITSPTVSIKKVFQFVHKLCTQLVECTAEIALRLFLSCAIVASEADDSHPGMFEPICYEFLTQALVCYEEELSAGRSQFQGIVMFVGTLCSHVHCLEPDNYDNLAAKITQHSAKLLKKPDQCKAILLCSHLFWNNAKHRDARRVLECLQKCLKIADVSVQSSASHVGLFTDILDEYVYYFDQNNEEITAEFIQNLIALCAEHVKYSDSEANEEVLKNFCNTLKYINHRVENDTSSKYNGLKLSDFEILQAS